MLYALTLYDTDRDGRIVLHAMPVMLTVLVCLAIAYRFYSKFLAAKVACLDDANVTPAHRLTDGQNYHPTNKWVLFGHHFAAISGAGPLIGPVLAIQYGYMPGLLWLVIGVCLAGAVQDMLVLAASTRRDGKSLAEIARRELGPTASIVASVAILFIIVIALAGLGFVVVKALGGEEVKLPKDMTIVVPANREVMGRVAEQGPNGPWVYHFPPGCQVRYRPGEPVSLRPESFQVRTPTGNLFHMPVPADKQWGDGRPGSEPKANLDIPTLEVLGFAYPYDVTWHLPAGSVQVVPGSSWGTFTIAATIPIALLVGLWMYKLRPGKVVEASLVGGALTLGAVVVGNWVPGSALEPFFSLSRDGTILALTGYGFVAAVLPVWLLLGPRDYLSSFLKIGTVALLVGSVMVANPPLHAPALNETFFNGGPTFRGGLFPFVFICIMCGAVSGFHSLVSSGTTPKMLDKESHIRPIGYGAMLIEGLVGVTALIAAAALPNDLYYDINIAIDEAPAYREQLKQINDRYGRDRLHAVGVDTLTHLDLKTAEEQAGGEALRGRTGGAVTLAVGMSKVFHDAFHMIGVTGDGLLKYWYHFAIMFEALFILTTIDAGTRIGRFLLQESLGRVYAPFARPDWLPGALLASAVITGGWGWLIWAGSIRTIWPMFGVANQLLAVLALSLVTVWLVNSGRGRYAWVTVLPMLWVCATTVTAASLLVTQQFPDDIRSGKVLSGYLNIGLTVFVLCLVGGLVLTAMAKCGTAVLARNRG